MAIRPLFTQRGSLFLGLAVVYFAYLGLFGPKLWRGDYVFDGSGNAQILEAEQWWNGRLDLPERLHDTALRDGRIYSHFPPMFTMLAALVVPFFAGVPHWYVVALLLLPLPALAYVLVTRVLHAAHPTARTADDSACPSVGITHRAGFARLLFFLLALLPVIAPIVVGRSNYSQVDWAKVATLALLAGVLILVIHRVDVVPPWREALLTLGFLCGTSLWPVADRTVRAASPYFVNHTLAVLGVLTLLIELFGRRRVWLAGLGLIIAAWSRQMTLAYVLMLAWMAFHASAGAARRRALMQLAAVVVVAVVVPMTLNALKFGSSTESGYGLIYEGRNDVFAEDARTHGVFSPVFIPRNVYYANFGFWDRTVITVAGVREAHYRPNDAGTGIWWTTPLLLWLFFELPRILRSAPDRWLLLTALLIFGALLTFHATGASQRGFNRFSLDYLPALFVLIVPVALAGWRTWISVGVIAWSVVYFVWMI